MATSDRGFASMDEDKQREIARKGGEASGGKNLKNVDRHKAGQKGAAAEPHEAKVKGGQHSHDNDR